MATVSTNEFRSGLKIILDNDPCVIVENEFVKPGKGQAFSSVRIKQSDDRQDGRQDVQVRRER